MRGNIRKILKLCIAALQFFISNRELCRAVCYSLFKLFIHCYDLMLKLLSAGNIPRIRNYCSNRLILQQVSPGSLKPEILIRLISGTILGHYR